MNELVKVFDGKVVTTSRKVAEVFEKQHKNVLLAIRELEVPEDFGRLNFQPAEYEAVNNLGKTVKYPEYLITRDGFTILAMGFTGKKAMEFKIAYINAFNAMEAELKEGKLIAETERKQNIANDTLTSSLELVNMINRQLLNGIPVDKDVLRYASQVSKLISKDRRPMPIAEDDPLVAFVMGLRAGEYTRQEVYEMFCDSCGNYYSPRYFWPRVRKIRPVIERREAYSRKVVFK